MVTGEPGTGKSALLAAAEAQARAAGYRVLTTTGVESEAQLPFAGLHRLLRPVLRPLMRAVLADDVQWLDPQSLEVLTFMAWQAT